LDNQLTYIGSKKGKQGGKTASFHGGVQAPSALDVISGRKSNAEVCREYGLAPDVIAAWKEQFNERAPGIFARGQSFSFLN